MAWIMDEYSQFHGFTPGSRDRQAARAARHRRGARRRPAAASSARSKIFCATRESLEDVRIAIQGFGNVGSHAALFAHRAGAKIVALSDVSGAVACARGLDVPALIEFARGRRSLTEYEGGEVRCISNAELLASEVDVLIPAALGGVLTSENARDVRARVIVEAANAPIEPEADEIFAGRGITVIPDILANAGGVIVSYFEWAQNIQCFRWSEDEVNERLKRIMDESYATVRKIVKSRNIPWRQAAYIVALGRVGKATVLRGV